MLPLGFRGNNPEQFSLCKAIIFHCKRAELCQFLPCSNLKEIQKHCCCRAWGWHTAMLQSNSHCGITSANGPREAGDGRGTGLYPPQRSPGWKTPCDIPETCLGSHQALQHLPPSRRWDTGTVAVLRDTGDPADSRSGDSSLGQPCLQNIIGVIKPN